jgi:hypothetical protein
VANRLFDGADVHIGPGTGYMGPDAVYGVMSAELARRDLGFAVTDDLTTTLRRYRALAREVGIA